MRQKLVAFITTISETTTLHLHSFQMAQPTRRNFYETLRQLSPSRMNLICRYLTAIVKPQF